MPQQEEAPVDGTSNRVSGEGEGGPQASPELSAYQKAVLAIGEGRLVDASNILQSVLETSDQDHRALFFLAWSLQLLGDHFLASQFFKVGARMAESAGDQAFIAMFAVQAPPPASS